MKSSAKCWARSVGRPLLFAGIAATGFCLATEAEPLLSGSASAPVPVVAPVVSAPAPALDTASEAEPDLLADDEAALALDSVPKPKSRADSVVLIRHRFNHREQIIAGGVVMACLAAMMAVMNNYNPR